MQPYHVAKSITFAYGHRLRNHDGPCKHAHGHNGRVEVECVGALDDQGMVVDFKAIERVLGSWIKENWDHRMILQRDDPLVPVLEKAGEPVYLMEGSPTAEAIARLLFDAAQELGFPVAEVRLWETANSLAIYRRGS